MRIPIFLPTTLLLAVACATSNETTDVWELVSTLPHDETGEGFVHLGDDGVLRSFSSAGQVIAYHALNPDQIAQYIERFPASVQEHLLEVYADVDGRNVTDPAQLTDPEIELRPPQAETGFESSASASAGSDAPPPSAVDGLSKRACRDYACSSNTLCWSYSCTRCSKADQLYWGYCL